MLDLTGEIAERRQVRAEYLDCKVAARTGQHLGYAHLDRLGEARLNAGQTLDRLTHLADHEILVAAPFGLRLQAHEAVGLVRPHWIETDLVGADAGDHILHLGHGA